MLLPAHPCAPPPHASAIDEVRTRGESCGGEVTCVVRGCPKGLGTPVFDKLEAELAKAIMSLPATKVHEVAVRFWCVVCGTVWHRSRGQGLLSSALGSGWKFMQVVLASLSPHQHDLLTSTLVPCGACRPLQGFEIGSGFSGSRMLGSEHNDEFYMADKGEIRTRTNR